MFAELLSIVAPVYVCAALGYLWVHSGRRFDSELITDLIMTIGAPCLVFSSLARISVDPAALVEMAWATVAALAAFAAGGALVVRGLGLPLHTFLSPIVFGNTGNMGLPLCLFAFGEEGLALGVVVFSVTSIAHFTFGQLIWSGGMPLAQLVRTPIVIAVVAAAVVLAFELSLPRWLERTTHLLGGFSIPLMQLSLGASLARLSLVHVPRSLGLSLARLGLGIGIGVGLSTLFELSGTARGVFVLDCAMPAAVFNYMMASRYQRSPDEVASLVVLSTLVSFLVIPPLIAWLL